MTAAADPMPRSARPAHRSPFAFVDRLLRDRGRFLDELDASNDPMRIGRALLLTVLASAGIFGAAIGTYRWFGPHSSAVQVVYGAIKLPLVVLLTAGLVSPALYAFERTLTDRASLTRGTLLVLASLALGCMVTSGLTPVVLLMIIAGASYHAITLALVGCCLAGGGYGLSLFVRGLVRRHGARGIAVAAAATAIFVMVGAQMAWSFRPYLVRPRAQTVPFMRSVEDGFADAVRRSVDSARGRFSRDEAPLPER